jgi:hypothetical protein
MNLAIGIKSNIQFCNMKFKEYLCLLLAFSLLVSNVELAFNVRYCGVDIASVNLKLFTRIKNQKNIVAE